jgi:formylglycine-generating enzyme required for sulfatase activity
MHHEQQHQELLLTDIKHAFSRNPLEPAYGSRMPRGIGHATPLQWHAFRGGLYEIGAEDDAFCFDNELPRHQEYVPSFEIAHRLITNGEFVEFIRDGGYERPSCGSRMAGCNARRISGRTRSIGRMRSTRSSRWRVAAHSIRRSPSAT